MASKKQSKSRPSKKKEAVKPRIVEASVSFVGHGTTGPQVARAERIEKVMNDAYNAGVEKGETDHEKLYELKMDAFRTFLENEEANG